MDTSRLIDELSSKLQSDGSIDNIRMIEIGDIIQTIGSLVLGLMSVLIVTLVPLIITLEICYICLPIMRGAADRLEKLLVKMEGRGIANKVLGFTLRDAKKAVTEANTRMIGEQSALWIYFKIKIKSIFLVFFVLVFVIQGYGPITDFLWRLFGGLVEALLGIK